MYELLHLILKAIGDTYAKFSRLLRFRIILRMNDER